MQDKFSKYTWEKEARLLIIKPVELVAGQMVVMVVAAIVLRLHLDLWEAVLEEAEEAKFVLEEYRML
jgi:hypothetical protein